MTHVESPGLRLYRKHLDAAAATLTKRLIQAGIETPVPGIIPTELEKGYRSRAKFKIYHREGNVRIVGTDPRRGEVPVKEVLWILPSWVRRVVEKICRKLGETEGPFPVHGLEIQLAHGREEIHVTLAVKRGAAGAYAPLAEILANDNREIVGVSVPSKKLIQGRVRLAHHLGGMDIFSDHRVFFQSNIQLTPCWLEQIRSWAISAEASRIVDLYCGVGLLAFFAAVKTMPLLGVENQPAAVCDARENARNMGFKSARFIRSAAEDFDAGKEIESRDLVLLDPPRTGCPSALISSLAKRRPRNVISISCCPETHVRDLCRWMQTGYRIESIRAYDAFPFTPFLETLAYLKSPDRC